MTFLKRNWGTLLLTTLVLIVSELIILFLVGSVTCQLGRSCFGGGGRGLDYSPVLYYTAWAIGWVLILAPIVVTFLYLSSKVGRKATIKLLSIYFVLGFLFTVGQLVGMENAWVVILLTLIIVLGMYYLFVKY